LVTDNFGCKSRDTITVTQPETLTLAVFGDSICYGGTAEVSSLASGGTLPYTYTWTGITGVTSGAGPHQISPTTSTIYTVSVLDSNNCLVNPKNVQVNVGSPLAIQATDAVACEDETAYISSVASGGGGSAVYQYNWNNGVNTSSQTVTVQNSDTYFIVTLTDGCSTPASDTSFVTVNLKPTASILALPTDGCVPLIVDFIAISDNGTQFYWNYGESTNVIGTLLDTTTYLYNNSGTYDVSLTVVNLEGCSTLVTNNDYIHVYPNPVANFTMNPNPTSILDTYVEFTDLSYSNINSWQWNFAGLSTSNIASPNYTFPDVAGDYQISLLVTNSNGCVDSISKTLIIKPEWGIYIPNAFTPDGDGDNDGFAPNGFGILEKDYSFYIFDRWGEKIFETQLLFETMGWHLQGQSCSGGCLCLEARV
jgi:PKD repeat protein